MNPQSIREAQTEEGHARNPVFPGFFPDPSTIAVDGRYYIAHSSFEWFPVVPIHSSPDLVQWSYTGALASSTDDAWNLAGAPDSLGVWAPSLSHDGQRFWIVVSILRSNVAGEKNIETVIATSNDAAVWSPPVRVPSTGFDPALFHDDGRLWLVNMAWDNAPNAERFAGITLVELDRETLQPLGAPQTILRTGTLIEGPNLYRTADGYLLTVAEGGTGWNHGITAFRADRLTGPWQRDPVGSLLTTRHRPGHPIQKAGHGEIVAADSDGPFFLVHLGSRVALEQGERRALLGRETYVQNLVWEDGWPRLANGTDLPEETFRPPAAIADAATAADDSTTDGLGRAWPWSGLRRSADRFTEALSPGRVVLRGSGSLTSQYEVSLLARRVQSAEHQFTVSVDAAPEGPWHGAGIALYYDTRNYFLLEATATDVGTLALSLILRDAGAVPQELLLDEAVRTLPAHLVRMRVTTRDLRTQFSVDVGAGWLDVGPELNFVTLSDDHDSTLQFTGPMFGVTARDTLLGQWTATFHDYVAEP